jgi:acyl-CoA thioesterase
MLVNDAATAWMGIEVQNFGPGHATCTMMLRPEMLNGFGIGHGGMIFAFADTAFAIACNDATATDTITLAAGVDVNFMAPAQPGRRLIATAVQRAAAGRSGLFDVTITQEPAPVPDGAAEAGRSAEPTLIAEFRGRSRTIPR